MTETVTITKEEYEMLLANTKRMNFLERYRPSMTKDREEEGVEFSVDTHGIIDTLRYGSVTECIDGVTYLVVNEKGITPKINADHYPYICNAKNTDIPQN